MNSCFTSQFNYCSLVWMFHSCTINNKIKHLYKICLHVVHSDKTSFLKKFQKRRSAPIHIQNLQILTTEIFKVNKDLPPTIFSEIFSKRSVQYNLHHASEFSAPHMNRKYRNCVSSRTKDFWFSSKGAHKALALLKCL